MLSEGLGVVFGIRPEATGTSRWGRGTGIGLITDRPERTGFSSSTVWPCGLCTENLRCICSSDGTLLWKVRCGLPPGSRFPGTYWASGRGTLMGTGGHAPSTDAIRTLIATSGNSGATAREEKLSAAERADTHHQSCARPAQIESPGHPRPLVCGGRRTAITRSTRPDPMRKQVPGIGRALRVDGIPDPSRGSVSTNRSTYCTPQRGQYVSGHPFPALTNSSVVRNVEAWWNVCLPRRRAPVRTLVSRLAKTPHYQQESCGRGILRYRRDGPISTTNANSCQLVSPGG